MVKDSVEVIQLRKGDLCRSRPIVSMESAVVVENFNVIVLDSLASPASISQFDPERRMGIALQHEQSVPPRQGRVESLDASSLREQLCCSLSQRCSDCI